jgi:hypothetical protein
MPNKRKQQSSFLVQAVSILAVPAALALVAYAGYNFVRNAYVNEQKLMAKEIAEVKITTDEEIRQEAAKSANLEYPVDKAAKTPEQIANEADASARKMTNTKFNRKILAEQIVNVIKSFKEATPGQNIEFARKNAVGTVKGTYKGRDGIFVLVDAQKYSIRDIMDEYRYLFDPDVGTVMTQEKINELKTSFKDESSKYFDENKKRIEEEILTSSGYIKTQDGSWRSKYDVFEEAFNELKSQRDGARQQEIRRIVMRHKLFGIYSVTAPILTKEQNQ